MRNSKMRILSLLVVMGMLMGVFAGCGGDTDTPATSGDASTGDSSTGDVKDSIVIATANETPSVNSTDHTATAANYMNQQTFDSLFVTNMELGVEPALVESYENVSETEWMFTLKSGVKFHNGDTMTAHDVVASYDRARTFPQTALTLEYIASYEAIDDMTLKITTTEPYAYLINDLSHYHLSILPKSLIDAGHDFGESPIGTGPYKFVEWVLGDEVVFEAFEEYFDGAPAIKHMTWKVIPEGASRTIMLETGEVDAIIEVETNDVPRIQENTDLKIFETPSVGHNFMMINTEVAPYDNQDFRLGLNHAINREDVIAVALNGMGIVANTQTPIGLPGHSAEGAYTYDEAKANEYFAAWGGDLSTVELPIICSDDTKRRAGEVIQASLLPYGINVTIESMDLATYLDTTASGDYTAAIGGYTASTMYSYVRGVWHSDSIGGSNKTRTNDAEVDRLIDLSSVTLDPDANIAALEELSAYLTGLAGQVPLYQPTYYRASAAGLMGYECNAAGWINYDKMYWA